MGTALASVDAGGAVLSDGRRIDAETVVWTAGVAANPLVAQLGLPTDERGRVVVDDHLRVRGVPGVWALGDCAAVPNAATPGELDPATCQHALRQARRLARNLGGTPRPYRYRTRGQMATLGTRHGIAVLGSIRVRGIVGWPSRAVTTCSSCRSPRAASASWPTGRPPRCSGATWPRSPTAAADGVPTALSRPSPQAPPDEGDPHP